MNLYLIGYRGCGKSTVAPLLAKQMNWTVLDTDRQIELLAEKTIAQIFDDDGEPVFRERETKAIEQASILTNHIVALGGGAILTETNRQLIASSGRTVWLNADPEVLWQRIQADSRSQHSRPALTELDGLAEVQRVLDERRNVYTACADYSIDTIRKTPHEIAEQIVKWWNLVDN